MTSLVGPHGVRRNWIKLIAVTLGSVVTVGLILGLVIFRITKCEDIDELPVRSPDGRWVAQSTTKACPAGPLAATNYDVFVTLSATTTTALAKPDPVRIFESDDSSEPPTITWPNSNVLILRVAHTGAVRVSKHEFANLTIKYVVPKWLWDNLGKIESDRLQQDRESEELYKAGKSSSNDLRISLDISQADAQEWRKFRQWVLENASHEGDSAGDTSNPE